MAVAMQDREQLLLHCGMGRAVGGWASLELCWSEGWACPQMGQPSGVAVGGVLEPHARRPMHAPPSVFWHACLASGVLREIGWH